MIENQISLFNMLDNTLVQTEEDKYPEKTQSNYYIGRKVTVNYDGVLYPAVITRIYNNGDTINCSFNGNATAFHISAVYI